MPSDAAHSFTLQPHPITPSAALRHIAGIVCKRDGALWVTYTLEGDIDRLRVPPLNAPRFADGLWRHTCCELFIACKGEAAYHECNFSPSRAWAAYAFARTRERAAHTQQQALTALAPEITVHRSTQRLDLYATVRLNMLSPRYTDAALVLGLSAVIEDSNGALSYWALAHPRPQPDFHHPDAFVLELDEVRN